jgi:uncharacterized membrane protein HdeD (DUF308 family)
MALLSGVFLSQYMFRNQTWGSVNEKMMLIIWILCCIAFALLANQKDLSVQSPVLGGLFGLSAVAGIFIVNPRRG